MKYIVIPGVCCNGTCKRVPVMAKLFSDAWIALCEPCSQEKVKLDGKTVDKIIAAQKMNAHVKKRS